MTKETKVYQNSPPEAYASPYGEDTRQTKFVTEPAFYETDNEVQERMDTLYTAGVNNDLEPGFQEVFDAELDILDLDKGKIDQDTFWKKHINLVSGLDAMWREKVHQGSDIVITELAKEISDERLNSEDAKNLLKARHRDIWSEVRDVYRYPNNPLRNIGALAVHNGATRAVTLNLPTLLIDASKQGKPLLEPSLLSLDDLVRHEMMHAAFAAWYDPSAEFTGVMSNGISIHGANEGDDWLNEGTIEKFRTTRLEGTHFTYEPAVIALSVADAIDPTFEKSRLRTAVLNENRGAMIGKLENIFGPLADENIKRMISKVTRANDLPVFKLELVALLHEDKREQAGAVFDEMAISIFEKLGSTKEKYQEILSSLRET